MSKDEDISTIYFHCLIDSSWDLKRVFKNQSNALLIFLLFISSYHYRIKAIGISDLSQVHSSVNCPGIPLLKGSDEDISTFSSVAFSSLDWLTTVSIVRGRKNNTKKEIKKENNKVYFLPYSNFISLRKGPWQFQHRDLYL